MNNLINKFLLEKDKCMPEMNLGQLIFAFSGFGPFTKNKERIQKYSETEDLRYIYQN